MIKKIFTIILAVAGLALALPALAATTPSVTQVACVGSAVSVRESALDGGIAAFTQAENSAYTARASALQVAYSLTPGGNAIKNAIKAAWTTFTSSIKTARKTWQITRNSAWSTFRASVKACKAPAVATDTANSSSEASGN